MDCAVSEKLMCYPPSVRASLTLIRKHIFDVAEKLDKDVEESLKWGQLSYVVKGGTAIRLDWDDNNPAYLIILFHCQTQMIETLREVMPESFVYKGNRAALLDLQHDIPLSELQTCIEVAFTYKARKGLFLLGL
ncbi:DUF1801 domain-containing protein [Enterovibrio nigricans]|uniref:YdhG-like domain-containing protein n=1 Tax=Enterovibrio nigricans DSM 22720 TaxID=1121868 RepID=A0A1T4UIR3_9GAMM|nr:DUF1801 domain-containing protein [Enterovibrio nigricans]SKA52438.1 hypothetical protein SAMN02745132_01818 [Enterovibrio nigricans DSM 22720]